MKHYKVTYYDGKGYRLLFVKAASTNKAIAAAKVILTKHKVKGATIAGAERIPARIFPEVEGLIEPEFDWDGFLEAVDEYARHNVVRDPKLIENMLKRRT